MLFYGTLFPFSSPFAKEVRVFGLAFLLAWIAMEFWDYGLWKAHVRGECYDVVGQSGTFTVFLTAAVITAMIWYQRGSLDGIDVRLFFLNSFVMAVTMLVLTETGNWFPMAPTSSTRNTWTSDHHVYGPIFMPLYCLPGLKWLYDNWKTVDRFSRMLKQILVIVYASCALSIAFSFGNWGSIWCLSASALIGVFDVHLVLDRFYSPTKAEGTVDGNTQQDVA